MCKVEGLSVSEILIGWLTQKGRAPLPRTSGPEEMLEFLWGQINSSNMLKG